MATVASTSLSPRGRSRSRLRAWIAAAAVATLLTSSGLLVGSAGASAPLGDPAEIAHWNLVGQAALLADNNPTTGKKPQEHFLYLAFLNIAMYDAIVGIDGRYVPYMGHASPAADASDQAAAIAAAHRVLEHYVPMAQAALDAAFNVSKNAIPDGTQAQADAKQHGLDYGTLVANDLIALRANDGRNANITYNKTPAPGVWRPTPPAFLDMFVPWMGAVKPLVLKSGAQFGEPGLPYTLTSKQYTKEFNEVKRMGGNVATGSDRTADQTATALFFSGNAQVQYTGALIDQANIREHGHRRRRPPVRGGQYEHRRRAHRGLAREAAVRVLAADHGDQPGRHRRQSRHGGQHQLGPAADDPALSRLRERLLGRDRRLHAITPEDARHGPAGRDAPLDRGVPGTRHFDKAGDLNDAVDQRPDLARHPLPSGRRRRGQDGPARRELGAWPRIPAGRRLSR